MEIKSKIKYLTEDDVAKIIAAIKGQKIRPLRDKAIFETLFSTGLRISECLALPDAPFANAGNETIELSIVGKGGWQRTIYFSPKALEAIKRYLKKRKDDSPLLFPVGKRNIQNVIKTRARRAGFEGVHAHTLRHSFAVNLLNKGVNLFWVKEFMGHRALSSTQIYLHVSNAELKNIHNKIYQ